MGDLKTLSKARMVLEEFFSGVPDDSVNLIFQDLAIHLKPSKNSRLEKINTTTNVEPIQEAKTSKQAYPLTKLPSLDLIIGLQASKNHHQSHHLAEGHPPDQSHKHYRQHDDPLRPYGNIGSDHCDQSHHGHANIGREVISKSRFAPERSREFDAVSVVRMNSMYQERPRRPGIPHSNICIVCSTYIYIFRHRCSVCGRAHCRNCVSIGIGEMTEGRKCLDCLGRRFSQRYISRAGMVGCCSGYPGTVKQAELKWAEKGSRGESIYSIMTSRSGSPMTPQSAQNKQGKFTLN